MPNEMCSGNSPSAESKDETKINSSSIATNEISSDALVADLLKEVQTSAKPFSMDEIANEVKKHKKHIKDKKHKKKKSKKSKSKRRREKTRSRSRSRSRSSSDYSRSRKSRKRSKISRSHSRSRSQSNSLVIEKGSFKKDDIQFDRISSSDDDLPMGADYSSVKQLTPPPIQHEDEKMDLSLLPSDIPVAPIRMKEAFPLSKERKQSESPPLVKKESELLKKVIEEKGKPNFVPRNLKINFGKLTLPTLATAEPTTTDKNSETNSVKKEEPDTISDTSLDENIKNGTVKREIVTEVKPSEKSSVSRTPSVGTLFAKRKVRSYSKTRKRSSSRSSSRSRSSSGSRATDELIKKTVIRGRGAMSKGMHSDRQPNKFRLNWRDRRSRSTSRNGKRSRSRSRSRDWRSKRQQRRRSRSRSYSRSRSRSRDRRRSRSRSRERGRYGDRNWQRKRSSSRDRYGKRKFVRDKSGKIDKQKLYEIAQKKAKQLQQMGLMSSTGQLNDTSGKSIDQIVEYCQRLSKREEKEARREKGESVSSDSELENFAVKHPYDVRPSAPITINIANAIPIPIRSAQERIMDEAQLRLCYPVSSGAIHKDNTEWQPVDKDPIPILCTDKVKKLTAITSLQVEEAKKMGVELPAPVPLLPPPPMPPEFDNLPPPPCPPSFVSSRSSSSSMVLPPPPLPPMIIQAPPEKLIMKEPEKEVKAPKDVAKVLAQRAAAARRLEADPNDYDARKELKELDEQMAAWATRGNLPGKFTGSTGIRILSADELQPHDPRYNAWVKKDQFKVSRPVQSGVGMKLMQKMGWAPGEGLGKDKLGNLEPLQLDVKNDRKGLSTVEEVKPKKSKPVVVDARVAQPGLVQPTIVGNGAAVIMNENALGNRNPVSLVMEFCAKRKWPAPTFKCFEEGGQTKCFRWEVSLNGVTYSTGSTSSTKKAAKALACQVVLQSLGLIKRDPALPMVF